MLQLRAMPVVFNTFAGWTTKNPIHIKGLWPIENPSGPVGSEFRYSVPVLRNIQQTGANSEAARVFAGGRLSSDWYEACHRSDYRFVGNRPK